MSHIAFTDEGVVDEVDHVVVGSGAGGANAALVLARAGRSVALVETGAWRDPHDYPKSAWGGMRDLMPRTGASMLVGRAAWPIVQGEAVGGSTVINSAIRVRPPSDVFANWSRQFGLPGERLEREVADALDAVDAELGWEETPDAALGRHNELALRGAGALGYASHRTDRYTRGCSGCGNCLNGCRDDAKRSLQRNLIPEVLARGGRVLSCAPADRVLFEGQRAVGVSGHFRHPADRRRGGAWRLRARRGVVVAASVTGTAPLLHRSGYRHPALGAGFRSHPGTGVHGWYDEVVDMGRGATQGWSSMAFRDEPGFKLESLSLPPELVIGRLAGGGRTLVQRMDDIRHLAMWVLAVRAESVGRVSTWLGQGVVHYDLNAADMVRLRTGMTTLARTHFAAGARWVVPGIAGLPYRIAPDEIGLMENAPLDPRAYVVILSHLFGGATMGSDPATSVCDARGAVRGAQGLWVADASLIPNVLGVNPQATIMGLARVVGAAAAA